MIPTVKEPESEWSKMGIFEHCFFCDKTTDYWHWRTNQPVCLDCAKIHRVSELPKSHPDYKVPTKEEYLKR